MKIQTSVRPLLLTLLMLLVVGCENDAPNTQIRVIIDSDLEVGTELTKIEVRVFDPDGKEELRRQDFALGNKREGARFELPMSFRLAPDSQRSTTDFRLVVTGIGPLGPGGSDVEVVEQQALASFRPAEALRLDIFLGRSCLLKLCRDDSEKLSSLTCDVETGACVDVPTRQDLPAVSGDGVQQYEEEKSDAGGSRGVEPEAGTLDAADSHVNQPLDAAVDERDAASDSGLVDAFPAEGGNDAGLLDASDGATSMEASIDATLGIATVSTSCANEGARACGGHNSSEALLCSGGKWTVRTVCDGNTRCDTREGGSRGTCQAVVSSCIGKQPNEMVCEGAVIRTCGADLIDSTTTTCAASQHCAAAPSAHCECDVGYQAGSGETCNNIDDCAGNACQHGGRCMDGVAMYTCDCAGTGFQGDFCQTDIDECQQVNVCSSEYPCAQTQPAGYVCIGQMADWPMPDTTDGSKTAQSYSLEATVVTDSATRLMWQRNVPAIYPGRSGREYDDPDQPNGVLGASCTWQEASTYCSGLVLGGRADWRLPSKVELESLLDTSIDNINAPLGDPGAPMELQGVFGGTHADGYWTLSRDVSSLEAHWAVSFSSARAAPWTDVGRVRCVRDTAVRGPGTPGSRYLVNADGTVSDRRTGLTWLQAVQGQHAWRDAKTLCEGYSRGGVLFRLPTLKELFTLVDPTRTNPAIDQAVFPGTPSDFVFAGNPPVNKTSLSTYYGLVVDFASGTSRYYTAADPAFVRCLLAD